MSEVTAIQTQIEDLENQLSTLYEKLKFAQEKEQMLACFRAALLTEYKAGDVTDVAFERIMSAIGGEPLDVETEKAPEKETSEAA